MPIFSLPKSGGRLVRPDDLRRSDIIGISLVAENKRQITDYESAPGLLDMSEIRKRNRSFAPGPIQRFSNHRPKPGRKHARPHRRPETL